MGCTPSENPPESTNDNLSAYIKKGDSDNLESPFFIYPLYNGAYDEHNGYAEDSV